MTMRSSLTLRGSRLRKRERPLALSKSAVNCEYYIGYYMEAMKYEGLILFRVSSINMQAYLQQMATFYTTDVKADANRIDAKGKVACQSLELQNQSQYNVLMLYLSGWWINITKFST